MTDEAGGAASWAVATIAREPESVLRRFVDWHLGAGAGRVHVVLDDPDDPAAALFADEPRVEVVRATPAYWARLGMADERRFTKRQNAAMLDAYHRADEDWLLICDADELLRFDGHLAAALAGIAPGIASVRVAPAEAVRAPDGGVLFRRPAPRWLLRRAHGADLGLFRKRAGLVGHMEGKALHRTGRRDVFVRQHAIHDAATGKALRTARWGPEDGAHLLHMNLEDWSAWRAKLPWRVSSRGFAAHARDVLERALSAGDEAGIHALYRRLGTLDAAALAALDEGGALLREPRVAPPKGDPHGFSIVAILRETPERTLRFVDWHLALGAERMLIYLDDPDDPVAADLEALGPVEVVRCTAAFWRSIGLDPGAHFTSRQRAALLHGYRSVPAGWVAVVDGDEFLAPRGGRTVRDLLAAAPPDRQAVRLTPAEEVGLAGGRRSLRLPCARRKARAIYGDVAWLVARNAGLVGHRLGKCLLRAGLPLTEMNPHFGLLAGRARPVEHGCATDEAVLVHLAGEDWESWRAKAGWRASHVPRPARANLVKAMRAALEAGDEAALRELHGALFRIGARTEAALRADGRLVEDEAFAVLLDRRPGAGLRGAA